MYSLCCLAGKKHVNIGQEAGERLIRASEVE